MAPRRFLPKGKLYETRVFAQPVKHEKRSGLYCENASTTRLNWDMIH
jgi:hypothetical protein